MKAIKWLILILVIFLLVGAAGWRVHKHLTQKPAESIDKIQEKAGIPVRVYEVRKEDLRETISISGAIHAYQQARIAPTINERITGIHVQTGEAVSKGDLLVSLDDRDSQLNLQLLHARLVESQQQLLRLKNGYRAEEIEIALAQMEQARADHHLQEIEWSRQKKLYEEEATSLKLQQDSESRFYSSKAAYEAAQAQYKLMETGPRQEDIRSAEAGVQLAEAARGQAEKNVEDHYLRSPIDGTVSMKRIEAGDVVDKNETVFYVVQLDPVYLDVDVAELYVAKLKVGMSVSVAMDAFPVRVFQGQLAEVNPIANSGDRTYTARILIENPDHVLKPGMFGRTHIMVKEIAQALVVPSDAVRHDAGDDVVLVVDEDNRAWRRVIQKGSLYRDLYEIQSGLSAGEKVITLAQNVKDGDRVTIQSN